MGVVGGAGLPKGGGGEGGGKSGWGGSGGGEGGEGGTAGVGVLGDTTVPLPLRLLNISPLHRSGDKPQASAEVFVTRALLVPAKPKKRTSTPYMPSCTQRHKDTV